MATASLNHVSREVFKPISPSYIYHKSTTPAEPSKTYSLIHDGPDIKRIGHFIRNYCDYFKALFSITHPKNASIESLKSKVDTELAKIDPARIDQLFETKLREGTPSALTETELLAIWLEAGAKATTATLNTAIHSKKPISAIQLLVTSGAIPTSQTVIVAIQKKYPKELIASLVDQITTHQGVLGPEILDAAIRSKMPIVQMLLGIGVPSSKEALRAAISSDFELSAIKVIFEAYVATCEEKTPPQDALHELLCKAIEHKKGAKENVSYLLSVGARVSSSTILTAIQCKAALPITQILLEELKKHESTPALNNFLDAAVLAGHAQESISFFLDQGATITTTTLNQVFSKNDLITSNSQALEIQNRASSLLEHAQPNEETLHQALACMSGGGKKYEAVDQTIKKLIDKGAIPSEESLHLALQNNHSLDTIKLIEGKGVQPSTTTLEIATKKGYYPETLQFLLDKGAKPSDKMLEDEVSKKDPNPALVKSCLKNGAKATPDILNTAVGSYGSTYPRPTENRIKIVDELLQQKDISPLASTMQKALRMHYPDATIIAFLYASRESISIAKGELFTEAVKQGYKRDTLDAFLSIWRMRPTFESVLAATNIGTMSLSNYLERRRWAGIA